VEYSEHNIFSTGVASDMLNGIKIVVKSSIRESKMDFAMTRLSGIWTSEDLTPELLRGIEAELTLLQPVSHANPSRSQENSLQKKTHGTNGRKLGMPLALYDLDTHSWKTSQGSLLSPISDEYSATWPKSGMMLGGRLYPLKIAVADTFGNGCGLWPTATVDGLHNRVGASPTSGDGLSTAVKLWPTPSTMDNIERKGLRPSRIATNRKTGYLSEMIMSPTPTKQDGENNAGPSQWNRNTQPLNVAVKSLFPSPVASGKLNGGTRDFERLHDLKNSGQISEEERRSMSAGNGGQLNPDWEAWLMGWPLNWSNPEPQKELVWLDWTQDPHPEPPRTATGMKNRTARLKMQGNGQVPVCVWAAWNLLMREKLTNEAILIQL